MGRIGRACARLLLSSQNFQLICANDIADSDIIRYLLKYDSVHRRFAGDLHDPYDPRDPHDFDGVKFSQESSPQDCDFRGADIVFDCTGRHLSAEGAEGLGSYLENGARRVIVSAPPQDSSVQIAPPLSKPNAPIVSAGSCTANALFLLCEVMRKNFATDTVLATSIHSYTSDQRLLDAKNSELRRGRSSTLNMIPVSTSAAKNLALYDPRYAKSAAAIGLRVPTPNVSVMQAVFLLDNHADREAINEAFMEAAKKYMPSVVEFSNAPNVLTDIIGSRASAVIDGALTLTIGKIASVTAWHDNEVGFAARMLDLAQI
ncbi:glyceraldehyde-3-phosphate dehydrogenase [Campylobacterota bacterium]|nr:glyceraldehyde-3-phosphate dehydrogenase [Campylobacterota bacterium]